MIRVWVVLVVLGALAGCGTLSDTAEPVTIETVPPGAPEPVTAEPVRPRPPRDLEGTEWVLNSLDGARPVAGTNITLAFSGGQASGFAGCNAYGGEYTAKGPGVLAIPMIAITAQLCESPGGVMEQEEVYVEALRTTTAYQVDGDCLTLGDATGQPRLEFGRQHELAMDPAALVGTAWQLFSANGSQPVEGSAITLEFSGDEIRGSAGCRRYTGTYEAGGDDIRFPMLAMAETVCAGPEALALQEGEYTTMLEWVTNYRLGEDQLELLTARGELLVYQPLGEGGDPAQEGSTWLLSAFVDGETATPLLEGSVITLAFDGGTLQEWGQVMGSAGCNTYGADYAFDGSFLTLQGLYFTEMACLEPEGVMEQETRYLALLPEVTVFRVEGDQLFLETSDGRALRFQVPP